MRPRIKNLSISLSLFALGLTVTSKTLGFPTANFLGIFPGLPGSDTWENRPADPDYPDMWHYFSHLPKNHVGNIPDNEKPLGSGMSIDKAWQLHTGTPSTLIAVLDSGVYWDAGDLRDRIWLNTKELPLPQGSTVYDKNNDGRVSVSDYEQDTRVSDVNKNSLIDVGDLIQAFSDHTDQDGNGFVDDVSGWDFHEHDNNPEDRIRFGHGTGEAKDSVGALNNDIGGAGVCGNCSVVFMRVNDSFVVDANSFSAAVHYGADLGAVVIQEALGSINYNQMTQDAVSYAWNHNTIIIGSAADENSYHHNYPATLDPVIYVNAIRFDTLKPTEANSFVAFNNCSNLGARVDVAASGISCSSEATGNLSGIAGLAASYAKSLGNPLTAGELSALIKSTSTDINLGSNENAKDRHSTWNGWDRVTGYGRVNAFSMLQSIANNQIPPMSRIVSPKWFEVIRKGQQNLLPITIEAAARSEKMNVKLEVARGVDTADSQWRTIEDSKNIKQTFKGLFATIDLTSLNSLPLNHLDGKEYANAFTFRLTVDNNQGQISESRRTIYLFESENLLSQFPRFMGASGESAGLFIDLDGNAAQEYVTVDGAGMIHAYVANGGELPGFPLAASGTSAYNLRSKLRLNTQTVLSGVFAPIAGGDLNQDGKNEIVIASLEGDVSVVYFEGDTPKTRHWKLPFPDMTQASNVQVFAQGIFASPVISDIDQDHKQEIIITSADGKLYVFNDRGQLKTGFPVVVSKDATLAKILSSPAVYDVNDDGIKDFVLGTNHFGRNAGFLYAVDGRGKSITKSIMAGFPVQIPLIRDALLPTVGTGIPTAPVIADFDRDGKKEILIHGFAGKAYVVGLNGQLKSSLSIEIPAGGPSKEESIITGFGHPAVADLTGQGLLSPIVLGTSSKMLMSLALGGKRFDYDHLVGAWNIQTGKLTTGWPRITDDLPLMPSPVSADLDNDGKDNIVVGSGGYFLHAYAEQGELPGFPAFTGGWMISSPSIGDIDGDGLLEIAGTTREGYVFVWKTPGSTNGKKTWPTFKGNTQRTGVEGEQK